MLVIKNLPACTMFICVWSSYSLAGIPRPTVAKMSINRKPLDVLADLEIEKQLKRRKERKELINKIKYPLLPYPKKSSNV